MNTTPLAEVNYNLLNIFIVLVTINFLYGFIHVVFLKKKNLFFTIISELLVFSLIGYLLYLNYIDTNNPDWEMYRQTYDILQYGLLGGSREPAYQALEQFGYGLGLTYPQFRVFVIGLSYAMFYISAKMLKANPNLVFALYSFFPFDYDATQMRMLIAYSIVILGLCFLIKKGLYGAYAYACLVVIAGLFHSTSYVFLLYLVIKFRIKGQALLVYPLCVIGIYVATICYESITPFYELIKSLHVPEQIIYKLDQYVGVYFWIWQTIPIYGSVLFSTTGTFLAYKGLAINKSFGEEVDFDTENVKSFFFINMASILLFPTMMFSFQFYRFFRDLLVMNILAFAITLKGAKIKPNSCIIFGAALIVSGVILFGLFNNDLDGIAAVFLRFFDYN